MGISIARSKHWSANLSSHRSGDNPEDRNRGRGRGLVEGIVFEITSDGPRLRGSVLTMSQLIEHYRRRELSVDNTWKSYATKMGYENYLKRRIDPRWGMRKQIHPATEKLGIKKRIGWHTFRHSYSTLLRHLGTDIKVQPDLLRHSSARPTLDTYAQADTPASERLKMRS